MTSASRATSNSAVTMCFSGSKRLFRCAASALQKCASTQPIRRGTNGCCVESHRSCGARPTIEPELGSEIDHSTRETAWTERCATTASVLTVCDARVAASWLLPERFLRAIKEPEAVGFMLAEIAEYLGASRRSGSPSEALRVRMAA